LGALTLGISLPANAIQPAPGHRFQDVYTREWSWREAQRLDEDEDQTAAHKEIRSQLPRVDAATQQARLAHWSAVMRQLDAIQPGSLRPEDRTNYSIYLGEMAIWKARHKAEAALGSRFNIRAFHDTVLAMGSVPLQVLEDRIDVFIAQGGKGPYPEME
jgi:uncharacterized protein (DUF885 family)